MRVYGSEGYLIADATTGEVVERHHGDHPDYANIERFNFNSIKLPWIVTDEVDILYIDYWYKDGTYEEPIPYETVNNPYAGDTA